MLTIYWLDLDLQDGSRPFLAHFVFISPTLGFAEAVYNTFEQSCETPMINQTIEPDQTGPSCICMLYLYIL